jgi:hypothetical protein
LSTRWGRIATLPVLLTQFAWPYSGVSYALSATLPSRQYQSIDCSGSADALSAEKRQNIQDLVILGLSHSILGSVSSTSSPISKGVDGVRSSDCSTTAILFMMESRHKVMVWMSGSRKLGPSVLAATVDVFLRFHPFCTFSFIQNTMATKRERSAVEARAVEARIARENVEATTVIAESSLTVTQNSRDGDRSRSRNRSRSPARRERRYDSRSRSPDRERRYRRDRSPANGHYDGGRYSDRGSRPAPLSQQDRSAMMANVRESSQQERRVYVGNLPYDVKWAALKDFMKEGKFVTSPHFTVTTCTDTSQPVKSSSQTFSYFRME